MENLVPAVIKATVTLVKKNVVLIGSTDTMRNTVEPGQSLRKQLRQTDTSGGNETRSSEEGDHDRLDVKENLQFLAKNVSSVSRANSRSNQRREVNA